MFCEARGRRSCRPRWRCTPSRGARWTCARTSPSPTASAHASTLDSATLSTSPWAARQELRCVCYHLSRRESKGCVCPLTHTRLAVSAVAGARRPSRRDTCRPTKPPLARIRRGRLRSRATRDDTRRRARRSRAWLDGGACGRDCDAQRRAVLPRLHARRREERRRGWKRASLPSGCRKRECVRCEHPMGGDSDGRESARRGRREKQGKRAQVAEMNNEVQMVC